MPVQSESQEQRQASTSSVPATPLAQPKSGALSSPSHGDIDVAPVAQPSQWLFLPSDIHSTPSVLSNTQTPTSERAQRIKGISVIVRMCETLRLPINVQCTASFFLHRFYMRRAMTGTTPSLPSGGGRGFAVHEMAPTCVWLACKVEESHRRTSNVIDACMQIITTPPFDNAPRTSASSSERNDFTVWRERMCYCEAALLEALCFDLILDAPHACLIRACKALKTTRDLARLATAHLNYIMYGVECLFFEAPILAAVAFRLACEFVDLQPSQFSVNPPIVFAGELSQGWLDAFDVDEAEVREAYPIISDLLQSPVMRPIIAVSSAPPSGAATPHIGTPYTGAATPYAGGSNSTPSSIKTAMLELPFDAAAALANVDDTARGREEPMGYRVATDHYGAAREVPSERRPPSRHGNALGMGAAVGAPMGLGSFSGAAAAAAATAAKGFVAVSPKLHKQESRATTAREGSDRDTAPYVPKSPNFGARAPAAAGGVAREKLDKQVQMGPTIKTTAPAAATAAAASSVSYVAVSPNVGGPAALEAEAAATGRKSTELPLKRAREAAEEEWGGKVRRKTDD